jgi:hypothetical protein
LTLKLEAFIDLEQLIGALSPYGLNILEAL